MRALWITLAIVVADQITKTLVATNMYLGQSIPVVGDLLKWTYTQNPGMAFGASLGDGDIAKVILTVFSVAATVLIFFYIRHVKEAPFGYRASLALVLGGALGNVIDRVFYGMIYGECQTDAARFLHGCVVDFFHLDVGTFDILGRRLQVFPIGNLADLAIIAGVVGILLSQGAFKAYVASQTEAAQPVHAVGVEPEPSMETGTPPPVA